MPLTDRKTLKKNVNAWRRLVRWVDTKLEDAHHSPNHGNYKNPTNELFYILLSKKTNPLHYRSVYQEIAASFRAVDSETDEPEPDDDETDDPQNNTGA